VDRRVTQTGILRLCAAGRCQDSTGAILKLIPYVHEAEEQATALSAWAGEGAVPLLAESFDENGAALLIGMIAPGITLRPQDDPAGNRIARCHKRLVSVPASSVRGSLPSGLERLDALILANARHLRTLDPIFAGTESRCTEDEHDDEDENDSQISEFGFKHRRRPRKTTGTTARKIF
jgi:Aminoglycoside/hydroxyurea antibiotic resistance kinase